MNPSIDNNYCQPSICRRHLPLFKEDRPSFLLPRKWRGGQDKNIKNASFENCLTGPEVIFYLKEIFYALHSEEYLVP